MATRFSDKQPGGIVEALRRLRVPHDKIAEAIGLTRSAATKLVNGERGVQPNQIGPLMRLISDELAEIAPLIGPGAATEPPASPVPTLEHQLIDLMKRDDIGDAEREAIWTLIRYLTRQP